MQFPPSLFWDFSTDFYRLSAVEDSCLALQEKYQLNVNLILFCYWLAKNKQLLSIEQWQQIISISLPWEEIIKPLRQSRKLINHSTIAWPLDFKKESGDNITQIEINTERMQQLSIEQAFQQMQLVATSEDLDTLIKKNISRYLQALNIDTSLETIKAELDIVSTAFSTYQENKKTIAL